MQEGKVCFHGLPIQHEIINKRCVLNSKWWQSFYKNSFHRGSCQCPDGVQWWTYWALVLIRDDWNREKDDVFDKYLHHCVFLPLWDSFWKDKGRPLFVLSCRVGVKYFCQDFFDLLNVPKVSASTFYRYLKKVVYPVTYCYWLQQQAEIITELKVTKGRSLMKTKPDIVNFSQNQMMG